MQIDSAFQLAEHLRAVYAAHVTPDQEPDTIRPIDRETAIKLAQPPSGVDRGIWLYELCRFLTQKANAIAVALFDTDPPCSASTCSEMRASEWQYLCAAHDPPKSCCAIDYCCHTLDWAATQLTNSTLFPSRLALGIEGATSAQQLRKMTEVFRRVYRIFAHAWFQHHAVFWQIENKTGLYVFFKTVCDEYRLIPEDNYTIPPEAEGQTDAAEVDDRRGTMPVGNVMIARGNTTKRHRGSRMERDNSISTIIHEESEDDMSKRSDVSESTTQRSESLPFRLKERQLASEPDSEEHEAEDILTAIDRSVDESSHAPQSSPSTHVAADQTKLEDSDSDSAETGTPADGDDSKETSARTNDATDEKPHTNPE